MNNSSLQKSIESLLVEQDPMLLISGGAPLDEYHNEAKNIAMLLETAEDDNLYDSVLCLFVDAFGSQMIGEENKKRIKVIADKLNEIHSSHSVNH